MKISCRNFSIILLQSAFPRFSFVNYLAHITLMKSEKVYKKGFKVSISVKTLFYQEQQKNTESKSQD